MVHVDFCSVGHACDVNPLDGLAVSVGPVEPPIATVTFENCKYALPCCASDILLIL